MSVRTVVGRTPRFLQLERWLLQHLHALAYAEAGKRDLRLDFLRGLAVAVMVVDHVGGDTPLTRFSGGNRFIVSAAEGFVFLSGMVLGMVYGDRIRQGGFREAARGLLKRAFTLYRASAGMALAFVGLLLVADVRLWHDRSSGLGVENPVEAVLGAFSLRYSFQGSDVLVMYTLMLAVAPAVIYPLHTGRTGGVILASSALWALFQRSPEEVALPWRVLGSAFPLAAWQLLLVLGMAIGYHRARVMRWILAGSNLSRLTLLASGSAVYLLAWSNDLFGSAALPEAWFGDASYSSLFLKESLAPGRVLAFLSVAVLAYTLVHALWVPLKECLGWLLLPLGQNSLYVYIMHVFVVVLMYNLAPTLDWLPETTLNLAAQLAALAALWAMVRARFLFALVPR